MFSSNGTVLSFYHLAKGLKGLESVTTILFLLPAGSCVDRRHGGKCGEPQKAVKSIYTTLFSHLPKLSKTHRRETGDLHADLQNATEPDPLLRQPEAKDCQRYYLVVLIGAFAIERQRHFLFWEAS